MLKQLNQLAGKHLVVVQYGPQHHHSHEWVYNDAEIDSAKVVWARSLGNEQDQALLKYFSDRRVWLLMADERPIRTSQLRAANSESPKVIRKQTSFSTRAKGVDLYVAFDKLRRLSQAITNTAVFGSKSMALPNRKPQRSIQDFGWNDSAVGKKLMEVALHPSRLRRLDRWRPFFVSLGVGLSATNVRQLRVVAIYA